MLSTLLYRSRSAARLSRLAAGAVSNSWTGMRGICTSRVSVVRSPPTMALSARPDV
jgi:hypothetical protein